MIHKFQRSEQIFIPGNDFKTSTESLKDFIEMNFLIPDNDLERICDFASHDSGLEKIIFELPALIQSEISYEKLEIRFFSEFQDDFLQLEVGIFSSSDVNVSLKKEEVLEHKLYDLYPSDSADKVLLIME